MSRLIVASNRVVDLDKAAQSGGLAIALGAAMKRERGLWFGWDGTIVDGEAQNGLRLTLQNCMRTATVPLTRREYDSYYLGFSNKILWPAFHYRLDLGVFDPGFIEGYRDTNKRLGSLLSALIEPDDIVWIHDYHLIPIADELRARGIGQRVGFFLHIPFPPPEIFTAVPEHLWLARCMFAYDVVGFQTSQDSANFIRYAVETAGAEMRGDDRIEAFGRTIVVKALPIGIDAAAMQKMAHSEEAANHIARLQRRSMANTFVIGVDRLDYTKGLVERMHAFRRLLELRPELSKTVTFMQIAPPTREDVEAYADIRRELEGLSGEINGAYGDYDWTPVRYVHRSVPRSTLAALYRGSRIGLVTPLRDGMNLVAKEYVASQDVDDPGVLILSKFAGASEQLAEALVVNPYEIEEVATAIHRGLTMSLEERSERHAALLATVNSSDVDAWRDTFLAILKGSGGAQH